MWFLILLIIFIVIGVVALIKFLKNCEKEQAEYEAKKRREAEKRAQQKAQQERNRKIYWNNLPNIYKNYSRTELEKIYSILQIIHQNKLSFGEFDSHKTDVWADACERLKKVLNYPGWKYGPTDNYISNSPVWPELDMKYVWNLIGQKK